MAQAAPVGASLVSGSREAGAWVPLAICNTMTKLHQQYGYLISYQDLWDQADTLVIKGKHTGMLGNMPFHFTFLTSALFLEFFIELDRQCGPLTMHSSLIDLVRYVREGIRRLRCERES